MNLVSSCDLYSCPQLNPDGVWHLKREIAEIELVIQGGTEKIGVLGSFVLYESNS
jgi:hypothetical protein